MARDNMIDLKRAIRIMKQRQEAVNALPDVHYGYVGSPPPDWRTHMDPDNLIDDDEELAVTPPDVVALLGFDPQDM